MMTMLHSVWSGGGSAAGRRRSLLALGALLALIASVLVWAAPTQAQGTNQPPVAIALTPTVSDTNNDDTNDRMTLNGTFSFDPDDGDTTNACGTGDTACTYKWEVVTASWKFLEGFADSTNTLTSVTAYIDISNVNLAGLVASNGAIIEFKLTVTDSKGASDSTNVTYNIATTEKPTADIALTATFEDEDAAATVTGAKRWTVDAVIDGPGENGNADNEWDIKEDSLLVLDASGSSDPDTPAGLTYTWARVFETGQTGNNRYPRPTNGDSLDTSTVATLANVGTTNTMVSTNTVEDPDTVIQTVGRLNVGVANQSPYYVIYQLTVTDPQGNSDVSQVRIAIHDQPADPTVSISIAGDVAATPDVDNASPPPPFRANVQGTLPPGSGRYVVHPGAELTLNATPYDADFDTDGSGVFNGTEGEADGAPVAVWSGDLDDDDGTTDGFQVAIPEDAEDGDSYTVTATIRGTQVSKSVTFVVVKGNNRPVATILTDGGGTDADGDPTTPNIVSVTPKDGVYTLTGFGFDQDGDSVTTVWTQIIAGKAAEADHDDYVELTGAFSNAVSFNKPTNPKHSGNVLLSFSAIDEHGAFQTVLGLVNIAADPSAPPSASAGGDQVVGSGSTVILSGSVSGIGETNSVDTWAWTITGLSTSPDPGTLTQRQSNAVHKSLLAFFDDANNNGILDLDANDDGTADDPEAFSDADASDTQTGGDGWPLRGVGDQAQYQYFTAPKLASGLKYAQIEFTLTATLTTAVTVNGESTSTLTSKATITVSDAFFASYIDGPDFCYNQSLGGPTTRPHDSDGDGTADVCSLPYTRREAVARQNALQQLADLGLTVEEDGFPSTFTELVIGRAESDGPDGINGNADDVSMTSGTCPQAKGLAPAPDDPDACDADATGLTDPPDPIDPADAALYYSGIITGPDFCTNFGLGGAQLYAHDSDDDGVADVCSLPYTRREAVARQIALEKFSAHAQFENAFKAACEALGSATFGASAAALAADACSVGLMNPMSPNPGSALP